MSYDNKAKKGTGHPNSRLNWDIVRAIRASDEPHSTLGTRYGVDPATVRLVRKNVTWKDPGYKPAGERKRGRPPLHTSGEKKK